ncbi:hypothetical protein [Pedobacter gandavensis]|uniref:Uncharacterized protein n=1 Tax=Pedobacter gandavensis TaxID=2679963 RepID=A0ABR6EV75_9SPHI|nr:hypothetical protein [Pedobacter gandavensis]MBB2149155.1 hypothetical protein [Pedobacter gandavensis]
MNIASFESACKLLKKATGIDYSQLPIVENIPEHLRTPVVSQYKLWVIAEASREGKKLSRGYYPWFWLDRAGSGSGFSYDGCFYGRVSSAVGARLEFPDSDSAIYAGKKHQDLYKDVMVIKETEYLTSKTK